jgi:predicted RNA binding protein YcfA (HicA-like mRNA interferase family)
MSKIQKSLLKILIGTSDQNIDFDELVNVLEYLEFSLRIKGSHHIFYREDIKEIINIQPNGTKAKAYQIKQIRNIILQYKLSDKFNNE